MGTTRPTFISLRSRSFADLPQAAAGELAGRLLGLAYLVEGLDFSGGEGGVVEGEFVDGSVEVADGELVTLSGQAPVADLTGAEAKGAARLVEGVDFAADLVTIKVLDGLAALVVVSDGDVMPATEVGGGEDGFGKIHLIPLAALLRFHRRVGRAIHEGKHEAAVFIDLPVRFAVVIAIGEQQAGVLFVHAVHLHPAGEGEGGVGAFQLEADAVAGIAELERVFLRPAALSPAGTDSGAVVGGLHRAGVIGHAAAPAVVGVFVEGIIGDEASVAAVLLLPGLPSSKTFGGVGLKLAAEVCDGEKVLWIGR